LRRRSGGDSSAVKRRRESRLEKAHALFVLAASRLAAALRKAWLLLLRKQKQGQGQQRGEKVLVQGKRAKGAGKPGRECSKGIGYSRTSV